MKAECEVSTRVTRVASCKRTVVIHCQPSAHCTNADMKYPLSMRLTIPNIGSYFTYIPTYLGRWVVLV